MPYDPYGEDYEKNNDERDDLYAAHFIKELKGQYKNALNTEDKIKILEEIIKCCNQLQNDESKLYNNETHTWAKDELNKALDLGKIIERYNNIVNLENRIKFLEELKSCIQIGHEKNKEILDWIEDELRLINVSSEELKKIELELKEKDAMKKREEKYHQETAKDYEIPGDKDDRDER